MEYTLLTELCLVCGDTAFGINYSVLTCTPCKAFFRRHSWKQKIPKCNFDGNCKINPVTRKFCQPCRLKKCYHVGMKSLTTSINTYNSNSSGEYSDDNNSYNNDNNILSNIFINDNISSSSFSDEELNAELMEIESYITLNSQTYSSESEYLSESTSCDSIKTLSFENKIIEKFNNELKIYISEPEYSYILNEDRKMALEFQSLFINNNINVSVDKFTDLEHDKFIELSNATNFIKQEYSVKRIIDTMDYWSAYAICSAKLEDDIKNIVKMSKNLHAFNCLCEEDKIVLLKYSAPEIIFLRSVKDFHCNKGQWSITVQHSDLSTLSLDLLRTWNKNIYDLSTILLRKIEDLYVDNVIIDLLTAIVLLNPERINLLNSDVIRYQQYVYMYLLQRYLLLKYRSENDTRVKFIMLLKCIQILNMISKKFTKNLIEDNYKLFNMIKYFGPLIKEIYDIK